DNLRIGIEHRCFKKLSDEKLPKPARDLLRAITIIASNLERIGDHAVSIVGQTGYFTDWSVVLKAEVRPFFSEIQKALDRIDDAVDNLDLHKGLLICRSEVKIDQLYKKAFDRIARVLSTGTNTLNHLTLLFIYRYLERIGDSLQNIGEALLFATVGEKIKLSQFDAMESSFTNAGIDFEMDNIDYSGIWETRSGCKIYTIRDLNRSQGRFVVYKEGAIGKLEQERDQLREWEALMPGLPPKVLGFSEHDGRGSMVLEYLSGITFRNIALSGTEKALSTALELLIGNVLRIWDKTIVREPSNAHHMRQLSRRIQEVLDVHPDFSFPNTSIGDLSLKSFETLLEEATVLEEPLASPVSVRIHGDFNNDNVIIEPDGMVFHYIDMHRSKVTDYTQDISVFLISNFRIPLFEKRIRERLNRINDAFYRATRAFAHNNGDTTFDLRLAFGLVRSFITSTRFELKEQFAKEMFQRAVYLLERVSRVDGSELSAFTLPEDIFHY
ncbi:phosphotransferase, partial [Myxococcota bacterium]|nr:phosphotransferase [Myxococcota bacterium]